MPIITAPMVRFMACKVLGLSEGIGFRAYDLRFSSVGFAKAGITSGWRGRRGAPRLARGEDSVGRGLNPKPSTLNREVAIRKPQ